MKSLLKFATDLLLLISNEDAGDSREGRSNNIYQFNKNVSPRESSVSRYKTNFENKSKERKKVR